MSLEGAAQMEYASLSGKIHTLVIDKSLSISGAAADAKATGEALVNATVGEGVIEAKIQKEVTKAFNEIVAISEEEIKDICK